MLEIGLILYGLLALFCLRPVAGHLAYNFMDAKKKRYSTLYENQTEPTGDQWFGAYVLAAVIACVWPAVAISVYQGRKFQIGAESEHKKQKLQKRVKELERELSL